MMRRRNFLIGSGALAASGAIRLYGGTGPTASPLKIAFFTDVHANGDSATGVQLKRAAEQINSWGADLLIGGGDYIHGGFKSEESTMRPNWEAARRFLDSLKGRVELVLGNHDMVGAGLGAKDPYRVAREELGVPIGARRFTAGDYTFFCLDPVRIDPGIENFGYRGEIDAKQLSWLEKELSALGTDDPIVLITHIPFRTLFLQAGDDLLAALSPSLIVKNANPLLERFADRNLVAVLQGHLHLDEHLILNGQSFITGGAVCGGWWKGPNRGTSQGSGVVDLGRRRPEWTYANF